MYLVIGEFTDEAPYTSDYTFENIYYRSIRERGGLPHRARLHLALGHRLVLVLEAYSSCRTRRSAGLVGKRRLNSDDLCEAAALEPALAAHAASSTG